MFTQPLPINGRFFWLHYSSFNESCHVALKIGGRGAFSSALLSKYYVVKGK
jgi:hypothetical protein